MRLFDLVTSCYITSSFLVMGFLAQIWPNSLSTGNNLMADG